MTKPRMKPKPRDPQVGDVWVRGASVAHVVEAVGTRVYLDDSDSLGIEESFLRADDWRLVSTGARTLDEREAAGELPDISDDDRTPLERMTAERDEAVAEALDWRNAESRAHESERDALRAELRNMRGAYQRLQARMVELETERAGWRTAAKLAEEQRDVLLHEALREVAE